MQHGIDPVAFGNRGEAMAAAVAGCVHCGFCLATCPTYRLTGAEAHSPRGRIVLMKEVLEGNLDTAEARPYIDTCLGCLACEPACPSGVPYGELLHPYRELSGDQGRGLVERWFRRLVHRTLPHPRRLRWALRVARLFRMALPWLPTTLRPLLDLAPAEPLPGSVAQPPVTAAVGERRARVALLVGCAQQVLAPEINTATLRLLSLQGVEVVVPPGQGCCGALAQHDGEHILARQLARRNLGAFEPTRLTSWAGSVDAVVSNAAGCSSALRELGQLFAGEDDEPAAEGLAERVVDVAVFLDRLGFRVPSATGAEAEGRHFRLAYQDACHLAQAQRIKGAPRRLLATLPGVELVSLADEDLCCGSAGVYNLFQGDNARRLAERKVDAILASGAEAVASGNIGCIVQLRHALAHRGIEIPVRHTVEWLADGVAGGW